MFKYYGPLLVLGLACFIRMYLVCYRGNTLCARSQNIGVEDSEITSSIKCRIVDVSRKYLPSPHSELLLGMTIGLDELNKVPKFDSALKDTGTIHVVVVSGFNISLLFGLVIRVIGSRYKLRNLILAEFITLIYSVFSGFNPPVIRAWIMGSVVAWGKYYGRSVDALRILIFSGLVMVLINPVFAFSASFQLSFMATLGLVCFSEYFKKLFVFDDLCTSLSAQVLVWPIISFYFGRLNILSPLVNFLILWTVPLSTVFGGVFLAISSVNGLLGGLLVVPLYLLLDIFVKVISFFSRFPIVTIDVKISMLFLCLYYLLVLVGYFLLKTKYENSKSFDRH
jgi:competence protein ComEC